MKEINIVTVLTGQQVLDLLEYGRIANINTSLILSGDGQQVMQNFLKDNTGYDNSPIVCVSKIDGDTASLERDISSYKRILNIEAHKFLMHFRTKQDVVAHIEAATLLQMQRKIREEDDEDLREELFEELDDMIYTGEPSKNSSDIIAVVPFLDIKCLQYYSYLLPTWEQQEQKIYSMTASTRAELMQLLRG